MTSVWNKPRAILLLEDGTVFRGYRFAGAGRALGEVVFNTSMTGYQEVLTDPSYKGQIVAMTYPLTGTYGVNPEDMESAAVQVEAFIVREYQDFASNWRSTRTLADFLEEHHKLGIEGIDTRALTRHIRQAGAMRGVIATDTENVVELLEEVRVFPGLTGVDLVQHVTCRRPYRWRQGGPQPGADWTQGASAARWRRSISALNTTSCACWNGPDARCWFFRLGLRPIRCWRRNRTAFSFPTVRGIPP